MPELPEVEHYTRYFERHALGRPIERVQVRDERILGAIRRDVFMRRLKGCSFRGVRRHGKHLFADAGATWLHLHFGMTGDLVFYGKNARGPRFARVIFTFADGRLAFDDMRLFGLAELVDDPDAYVNEKRLGPDPLDPQFTLGRFRALLERRRGAIKSLLMSQDVIAGLGNLYVDEMLFQSGVHPARAAGLIDERESGKLFRNMRRILNEAIARHGRGDALPPRYLYHHREIGAPCPQCGGNIERGVIFGRTTYYCGTHQS